MKIAIVAGLLSGLLTSPLGGQRVTQVHVASQGDMPSASPASILARSTGLEVRDVPLHEALLRLQSSAGVPFLFSPSLVPNERVSCECKDASVGAALTHLIEGRGLDYLVRNGLVMVFPVSASSPTSSITALVEPEPTVVEVVQPPVVGSVTGIVTDATTGQPLPAAQVFIDVLDLGVLTQQNGRYLIQNVPAGAHTVSVQRIGYRSVTASVVVADGGTAAQDFTLSEEAIQLDEVIVTGTPGGSRRRAIGNTVSRVDVSEVTQTLAVTNVQGLLTGRTPGVQFTRSSGNVGTGSPITIRGAGSFSDDRAQPIVFVDGVRVNSDSNAGPQLGGGSEVNVLDDFNPEDIQSVEIIKGPAAASLYGTEASAGVIQIITKRGAQGGAEFNASVRHGSIFMMNPRQVVSEVWSCPTDPQPGPTLCQNESELIAANMYDEANRYIREGYFPWPTENLFQNGHTESFNIDARGGTDAINYFLSANYDDEEGIVWYNTNEAMRLRANVGVVLSDNFSLDVSTGYAQGKTRFEAAAPGDGGVLNDLRWGNPYYLDRVTPFSLPGSNPRIGGFEEHLPSDIAEVLATREFHRFTGGATLNFTSGLLGLGAVGDLAINQRLILGLDRGDDINRSVFPLGDRIVPEHLRPYVTQWAPTYPQMTNGQMTYSRPISTVFSVDYSLTANLGIGDAFDFATSVGTQYIQKTDENFGNTGTGFASTLSTTVNQLTQSQVTTSYSLVENKSLGFYVQETVGWNDRVFLTAAVRSDDNSTFGSEAPAQTYPKLSASWLISEEPFFSFDFVNSLRFRGAWGKSGRQPSATVGRNIFVAFRGPGGTSGIRPSSPGNPAIQPEVSSEIELGFDLALLDDRLSLEFTHFSGKDEQALLGVPVSADYGFPGSVDRNLGQLNNWGWEAILGARLYRSDAFSFEVDVNADHTDNEIISLGEFPGTTEIQVGFPYPNVVTSNLVTHAEWDAAGFYANDFGRRFNAWCDNGKFLAPDPTAANAEQYGRMPGGDWIPCQTIFDREILAGRAFATYTFGVAPRITLLDGTLQVFAMAEGEYGRTGVDEMVQSTHIKNTTRVSRVQDDIDWVADDRLNNTAGRQSWGRSIYDADFWKLREIGARYTLPSAIVQRVGADRASLAVSANNLWTIWQAQTYISGSRITDPELGSAGIGTGGRYDMPPVTSINATLRVTF